MEATGKKQDLLTDKPEEVISSDLENVQSIPKHLCCKKRCGPFKIRTRCFHLVLILKGPHLFLQHKNTLFLF